MHHVFVDDLFLFSAHCTCTVVELVNKFVNITIGNNIIKEDRSHNDIIQVLRLPSARQKSEAVRLYRKAQ